MVGKNTEPSLQQTSIVRNGATESIAGKHLLAQEIAIMERTITSNWISKSEHSDGGNRLAKQSPCGCSNDREYDSDGG